MSLHPHPLARALRVLRHRPRLWSSLLLGLLLFQLLPADVAASATTRGLLAFNGATAVYLVLTGVMLRETDAGRMRRRALTQGEGRALVLFITVSGAVAVLVAVATQLAQLKLAGGALSWLHLGLVVATVAQSWLLTQVLFALNYAHDFYATRAAGLPDPLLFPGTPDPTYRDFLYFACVIGTSGQTADVSFNGGTLRAVGTLQCVLAFAFNTSVLGFTVNIAAGRL